MGLWAIGLMGATAFMQLLAALSTYAQIRLLQQALLGHRITQAMATANDSRQAFISLNLLAVSVAATILLSVWVYRARKNVAALGATELTYSPALAAWGSLILILAILMIGEIWKASDPEVPDGPSWKREARKTPLIALWWVGVFAANILGRISSTMAAKSTLPELIHASWLGVTGHLVGMVAGVIICFIIWEINRRQELKYQRVQEMAEAT